MEGTRLTNAFRWRDSVGPYENRPGHYGDVWNYWSDDGFGYYEGLQVCCLSFNAERPCSRTTVTNNYLFMIVFEIKSCGIGWIRSLQRIWGQRQFGSSTTVWGNIIT